MIFDVLRTKAEFNASEQSATGVDLGVDLKPRTYCVACTGKSGTSPTLDVKIQESDDNNTWRDLGVFPQITVEGKYYITLKSNARYRRHYSTLGGSNTPKFLNLVIGTVPAGRDTNW